MLSLLIFYYFFFKKMTEVLYLFWTLLTREGNICVNIDLRVAQWPVGFSPSLELE